MAIDPQDLMKSTAGLADAPAPLAGTRTERMQRLQVGLSGIAFVVLLVGIADIVITQAQQTEAGAVAEALPSAEPSDAGSDPLVDAGVVPELPAEPDLQAGASPSAETGDVPPPATQPTP